MEIGGKRTDVEIDRVGRFEQWVTVGGIRYRVIAAVTGLMHLIEVNGSLHRISRDDSSILRATDPSVVTAIDVKVGESVAAGQRLALLEAMKMEMPVTAPFMGTVRELMVLNNVQVGPGTPLLRVEPAGEQSSEPLTRLTFASAGAAVPGEDDPAFAIAEACRILMRHYEYTYMMPAESSARRALTRDPLDRDIRDFPHGDSHDEFPLLGDVFSDEKNAERKKPFDIRRVMHAVTDQDHEPLERWLGMRDAEIGVVWDAHIGGYPVCLLGFESRPLSRTGFVATDGPEQWTAGTLFPMSSKKIARAINASSANRPLVILANLSGFDGSPESMRRRQLEFGAEIGRAIVNFRGPIVFCVISRYHGGAFVVFSKALNRSMEVVALEGTYASVIGGAPAAAVVFAREVDARARMDPRLTALEKSLAAAEVGEKRKLQAQLAEFKKVVRSEKLGEVADEFDRVHTVQRALAVGSLDRIIPAGDLRPYLISAIERGLKAQTSTDARR